MKKKGIITKAKRSMASRLVAKIVIAVFVIVAVTVLFSVLIHAEDTIAKIEDGNLVYYQKTGNVVRDVPKGLTTEQAKQLVSGAIPKIPLLSQEIGFYFGFPLTDIKTETTVSFRSGWIVSEEVHESFSAAFLFMNISILLVGLYAAYVNELGVLLVAIFIILFVAIASVLSSDIESLQVIGALSFLFFSGYFLGYCLRRRKERNSLPANGGMISDELITRLGST